MSINPAWIDLLPTYCKTWCWSEADGALVGERQRDGHTQRLVVTCPLQIPGVALPITARLTAGRIVLTQTSTTVVPLVRELERQLADIIKRGAHTASDEQRVRPYAERYGDIT